MDTVCGLGVMCGIMVDMDLTLCNYIPLNQLTTRLNFIYLFIYLYIYCASLGLLLLLISSHKIERCIERGMVNTIQHEYVQNSDHICTFAHAQVYGQATGQRRTQVGCYSYRAAAVSCDIMALLTVKHIV